MTSEGSPTAALVGFVRELTWDDVPEGARRATRMAMLDSIGCMLAGSRTDLAQQAGIVIDALGGAPQATVSGRAMRTSAPFAAFLNAVHANALDYDDAFERDGKGMGHPGATVVPAALALAELVKASGAELAAAVTAGYEAVNRIIEAIQPTPQRHAEVWGVAVHQAFGAAVAAARLLRLPPDQFANAFGLAGALSTVPAARKWNWRDRPLFSFKDVVAAPAEAGVKAALFAEQDLQGSRDILDGRHGFWIMAGSDRQDEGRLTHGLGTRWTVEELSFKPYPACRWLHAALEACEHIMRTGGLTLADVARVEVGTFADVVENFAARRPPTMIDAEFSMPWTVAMILAGIPKGPDWYAAATLADPRLHDVADMVALVVDEEAQARHFSEERKSMSVVRISARDGRAFEKRVAVARGGAASPWPEGGIEAKFREQASAIIGAANAARLEALISSIDDRSDLTELFALLAQSQTG